MKKTIIYITFSLLIISKSSIAQDYPAAGSYLTNTTMGAFHGTWQWTNGFDTVRVRMMTLKVYYNANGGFHWDRLVGWLFYKRKADMIENSYAYIGSSDINYCSFFGGNEGDPVGHITLTFNDLTKKKHGDLTLTLNAAQNELTWKLRVSEGVKVRTSPSDPPFSRGFTLPTDMILKKL
jgi:hypothetical protein